MSEQRYIISDASKKVDVEPHVLRYWEEELSMDIGRNEMGHRFYTEHDIKTFKAIKELKEQGFQLKAMKLILQDIVKGDNYDIETIINMKEELNSKIENLKPYDDSKNTYNNDNTVVEYKRTSISAEKKDVSNSEDGIKMQQFKNIISSIVVSALRENNELMGNVVSESVSSNVIKEMDYLLRLKEEREEERFKRFDETIRNYQRGRAEIAASNIKEKGSRRKEKKKRMFEKKQKNIIDNL